MIWGGGRLAPGVGWALPPREEKERALWVPRPPPGARGGGRWAAESRLRSGSHHAAFSRNFDVIHTWGKGLGEREEAAGEGAGGRGATQGGGCVSGPARWAHKPRTRQCRWLSRPVGWRRLLCSLVRESKWRPCPRPSRPPPSFTNPPPQRVYFILLFTLKSRAALNSGKGLFLWVVVQFRSIATSA